jgi:tyrosyl-tRNA synthetase
MDPSFPDAASAAARLARNAVDCLPAGALEHRLGEGRPLRVKLGMDPTAPDVHLGHTVVLQKLREFQDDGHTVVLIVGDYTARVGDPSGRSSTRPMLSGAEIEAHGRTYVQQATRVLRTDERLEVRHNSEWLDMSMEALFGLVRTVTVAQILERDDFAKRWAASEPISMLELLYPVLQGYDSVAVRADVELGGTDQKFNLLMGRAIQQAFGQPAQVVLTMPLLVGTDGERKMSKSLGNHVGVSDAPEEMFGRVLSIPDAAMAGWYDLLLGSPPPAGLGPRDAKRALARALVERFAGAGAAERAQAHFDRVFVDREAPDAIEETVIACRDGVAHLPEVIADAFGGSRSDARRKLAQGGVRVNGQALAAESLDVACAELDGAVLQVGRRQFRRLRVRGPIPT